MIDSFGLKSNRIEILTVLLVYFSDSHSIPCAKSSPKKTGGSVDHGDEEEPEDFRSYHHYHQGRGRGGRGGKRGFHHRRGHGHSNSSER